MNLNKDPLNICKLQEMCHTKGWALPKFNATMKGPPQKPLFSASVFVDGLSFETEHMLRSKSEAECCAAGFALNYFNENSQQPQPKHTKCFSLPAQPSHRASPYLDWPCRTYKNETTSTEEEMDTVDLDELQMENALQPLLDSQLYLKEKERLASQRKISALEQALEEKEQKLKDLHDELQLAREMIIDGLRKNSKMSKIYIGVKTLGALDSEAFLVATKRTYPAEEEAIEMAAGLCGMWEDDVMDSEWKPFKVIRDEKGKRKVIIDEEDEKLKNLKTELGHEAYKVVTTSLMELNEHNPIGRYRIEELWNFIAGRKAILPEAVGYILKLWQSK